MCFPCRSRVFVALVLIVAATTTAVCVALHARPSAQVDSSEQVREIVATLATGRITIMKGRDGLMVAAVGNSFEPESLPPLIVPLNEGDVAIVLGADDWIVPPANHTLLRLDQQLPHLIQGTGPNIPSLRRGANVSHLDQLGLAILDPLRAAASNLHAQLQLPPDLPLAELVLVRQTEQEPLLVWDVSYWIHQTFWQENFWDTEVERPRSMQLYPTKENPSDLVQVSYPPGDASSDLQAWILHPTGPLAQAIETDPELSAAQKQIAGGRLQKIPLAQLVPLVKTALETMVSAGTTKELATVDEKNGFNWIIQSAASKSPPLKRPPGAPSLEDSPHLN